MIGPGGNLEKNVPFTRSLYQPLSIVGDGTGAISQNIDGDTTPTKFYIQPPSTEKYTLRRANIEIIDGNFNNATQYGAIGIPLAAGIRVYVENDSEILKEYTEFIRIKRSFDWSLLAGVDAVVQGGAGSDALTVRWTFSLGAADIELDGSDNQRFVVEILDDLTGLNEQIVFVQGKKGLL